MAETVYEGLFILDSNAYARDAHAVSSQIGNIVEQHGGEVLTSRMWEERRLAYPIKGQKKGTYWLTYFRAPGDQISGIYRDCEISDPILRALIIKVEPRIVDTLLSHARGEEAEAAAAAEEG